MDVGSGVGGKGGALRGSAGGFFLLRAGSAGATNVSEGALVLSLIGGTSWLVEPANEYINDRLHQ